MLKPLSASAGWQVGRACHLAIVDYRVRRVLSVAVWAALSARTLATWTSWFRDPGIEIMEYPQVAGEPSNKWEKMGSLDRRRAVRRQVQVRFKIAAALVAISAIVASVLSNLRTDDPVLAQPTRAAVSAISSEFDLPILVPVVMPTGFTWADESSFVAKGRWAEQRTVTYQNLQSRIVLETCFARTADRCETKVGDDVVETAAGFAIVIHFLSEPAPDVRQTWREATFTSNYKAAAWLK
jgi:hypothetical protein